MVSCLKFLALFFLSLSIIASSTPRCGNLMSSLKALDIVQQEVSCHESDKKPLDASLPSYGLGGGCKCDLLTFVSTKPSIAIRSIEKTITLVKKIAPTVFLYSFVNIILDRATPPPRF